MTYILMGVGKTSILTRGQRMAGAAPAGAATAAGSAATAWYPVHRSVRALDSGSSGDNALGGLTVAMIIASLLMTAGCARGLTRRLAEYR